MSQNDLRNHEIEDDSHEHPDLPHSPQSLRLAFSGALVALLIAAIGMAIFSTGGGYKALQGSVKAMLTSTPATSETQAPTPDVSTTHAPRRGVGLPAGAQVTNFALTGPDTGWATAVINVNPVTSVPNRGVVLRYSAGVWTQVGPALSGAFLGGLTMDSPTDGWVTGEGPDGKGLLLHIRGGVWSRAPLPAIDPVGWPEIVYAPSPDESWMVIGQRKFAQGGAFNVLLHASGGVWSLVVNTPHDITDIAPITPGKAWVIGVNSDGASSLVLVQNGRGTVTLTSPPYSGFSRLRMFAPNDVWIESAIHNASNLEVNDQSLTYHYDGATWSRVNLHAPGRSQHANVVAPGVVWSYSSFETASAASPDLDKIDSIYSNAGGPWRALSLPYDDLQSLTVLTSSSSDVWAIGVYQVMTRFTDASGQVTYGNVSHSTLLHYTGGSWIEYGR